MTVIKRCPKGMELDLLVAGCTTLLMLSDNFLNPIPFYPQCEASSPFDTDSELPIIGGCLASWPTWFFGTIHMTYNNIVHELNHQLPTLGTDVFCKSLKTWILLYCGR
jgi:hypothetical protein